MESYESFLLTKRAGTAKQANDTAMVEWATEIKVRAERRAGELLAAMDKNAGTRGQLAGRSLSGPAFQEVPEDSAPTLDSLGITHKQSSRWQKLAAVPQEEVRPGMDAATHSGCVRNEAIPRVEVRRVRQELFRTE